MSDEKIEVMAYSGYRGEESPRAFILRGERIEVVGVQERWMEERLDEKVRRRFFKVEGSDGVIHEIFYSEKSLEWYHRSQGE
jgi:hypothetical protein